MHARAMTMSSSWTMCKIKLADIEVKLEWGIELIINYEELWTFVSNVSQVYIYVA